LANGNGKIKHLLSYIHLTHHRPPTRLPLLAGLFAILAFITAAVRVG